MRDEPPDLLPTRNSLIDFGCEFYRYDQPLSPDLVGKEFSEAVQILAKKRILLLGFETEDSEDLRKHLPNDILHSLELGNRIIVVNPQNHYNIRQGDVLFLIAESAPTRL